MERKFGTVLLMCVILEVTLCAPVPEFESGQSLEEVQPMEPVLGRIVHRSPRQVNPTSNREQVINNIFQYIMDDSRQTRVKRTPAPTIWKLLGLNTPNRIDKNAEALLSTLLKFIVSPYVSIWQSLFEIGIAFLNSVTGYPTPPHAVTNPFIINHAPLGNRPVFSNYPTYNYPDPYVSAISYGIKLLQTLYL